MATGYRYDSMSNQHTGSRSHLASQTSPSQYRSSHYPSQPHQHSYHQPYQSHMQSRPALPAPGSMSINQHLAQPPQYGYGGQQQPVYPSIQSSFKHEPTSPSEDEDPLDRKRKLARPPPPPAVKASRGFRFEIEVVQQPDRARMCGYGDKDRRPISPPPVVWLRIYEEATGREIDYDRISYLHRFMCQADIWDENGNTSVNLVVSTQIGSPTISSTHPASYPTRILDQSPSTVVNPENMNNHDPTGQYRLGTGTYGPLSQHRPYNGAYGAPGHDGLSNRYNPTSAEHTSNRCLLGNLNTGAAKLKNTANILGLYFVFPDLSVRTEGVFLLKFKLFDVKHTEDIFKEPESTNADIHAPCLADCYSEVFSVYSAKKFPGVWESTDLSKCFAKQGIKIPIRKDGPTSGKRRRNGDRAGGGNGDGSNENSDDEDGL